VSAEYQARISAGARRRGRELATWEDARALIVDGVSIVQAPSLSREVRSSVRVIARQVERIDRQLRGR